MPAGGFLLGFGVQAKAELYIRELLRSQPHHDVCLVELPQPCLSLSQLWAKDSVNIVNIKVVARCLRATVLTFGNRCHCRHIDLIEKRVCDRTNGHACFPGMAGMDLVFRWCFGVEWWTVVRSTGGRGL